MIHPSTLKLKYAPFEVGEKVRPHFAFLNKFPDFTIATVKSIEPGNSETGWLVEVEEIPGRYKQYSSSWFYRITPNYKMYQEVTDKFQKLMIKELAANYDKGDRESDKGWLKMTNKQLLSELYYHVGKLQQALKENNIDLIKEHCADVANGALMCLDKHLPLI